MEVRGVCWIRVFIRISTYTNIHTGYSRDPFIFHNYMCASEKWFGDVSEQTVYIKIRAIFSIFPPSCFNALL